MKICRIFPSLHKWKDTDQKIDYWVGGEQQCSKCERYRHYEGAPTAYSEVIWKPGRYVPRVIREIPQKKASDTTLSIFEELKKESKNG